MKPKTTQHYKWMRQLFWRNKMYYKDDITELNIYQADPLVKRKFIVPVQSPKEKKEKELKEETVTKEFKKFKKTTK